MSIAVFQTYFTKDNKWNCGGLLEGPGRRAVTGAVRSLLQEQDQEQQGDKSENQPLSKD